VRVTQSTDQMVAVDPDNSEVQQPMRATAVLDRRPHMQWETASRDAPVVCIHVYAIAWPRKWFRA
jgi:hypothetical protein